MTNKLAAEAFGTFWLVLGGCGSAVLAAGFPDVGIGFMGVSLAFGLTVLTMAYAVGGISGGHFNPAVSLGLAVAGKFEWKNFFPYIVAQVIGGALGALVLYLIVSGKADFTSVGGFASNGYGANSPGGFSMMSALITEVVMTAFFLIIILGATSKLAPIRFRAHSHRPRADAHPPDFHSSDQHIGQSGPLNRSGFVCRWLGLAAAMVVLGGSVCRRCSGRCSLEIIALGR